MAQTETALTQTYLVNKTIQIVFASMHASKEIAIR